jgi:PilZ domain
MTNENTFAAGPVQRPRSPRVPVNFSVVVEGTTTEGKSFESQASIVKISCGGATIAIDAEIVTGDRVMLTPPFGRKLEAEVNGVWIDENDGRQRIGVRLLDADGWFAE